MKLLTYGSLSPGKMYHHIIKKIPGTWKSYRDYWIIDSPRLGEHIAMIPSFEGPGYKRIIVDDIHLYVPKIRLYFSLVRIAHRILSEFKSLLKK